LGEAIDFTLFFAENEQIDSPILVYNFIFQTSVENHISKQTLALVHTPVASM